MMARIRANGMLVADKSTGVKAIGLKFDYETGRFHKSEVSLNKELRDFEGDTFDKLEAVITKYGKDASLADLRASIKTDRVVIQPSPDSVMLSWLIRAYSERMSAGAIFNGRSGKKLSPETIETKARAAKSWIEWAEKNDFNFSRYNLSTVTAIGYSTVKSRYDKMIEDFKSWLTGRGLEDGSIFKEVYLFKQAITFMCRGEAIELGSFLDGLKYKYKEKDVQVLSPEQTSFIVNNFRSIESECETECQRVALEFVYVGLVLNARVGDMRRWHKDNLYQDDAGNNWLKYIPNKTKNSTGVVVDYPVPAVVMEVFTRNIELYDGNLMGYWGKGCNTKIKRIFSKYTLFQNEIQIVKKGEFVKVRQCDQLHIHQMRSSGVSEKLMRMPEALVKELTGHSHDSKAFARYVKVSNDAKLKYMSEMYK